MYQAVRMFCITITLALISCASLQVTHAPTPTADPTPSYFEYTPSDKAHIRINFIYPSSWILKREFTQGPYTFITLLDPRAPTPDPYDMHPDGLGNVSFWVKDSERNITVHSEVESLEQALANSNLHSLLADFKTSIDGYDTRVVEYQIKPSGEAYPVTMFERRYFFLVKEKLYTLRFIIAESERQGEFERGFDLLIKSVKIIP